MDAMLSAHIDGIGTECTVACNLLCPDGFAMLLKYHNLFFRCAGPEHVGAFLHIAAVRQLCITFCAGREEVHTAETGLIKMRFQFDGVNLHLSKQCAHGVLNVPFFYRNPAILYGHFHTVIVRERELRIPINYIPNKFNGPGRGAFF